MSPISRPPDLARAVEDGLAAWDTGNRTHRLWARDATLWTGADESRWLGWLDLAREGAVDLAPALRLRDELAGSGIRHVAVLGMGGSSLCPFVFASSIGSPGGFPLLRVLDSTVPEAVAAFEKGLDLDRTLFLVASKSGTTLEPNLMCDYFLGRCGDPRRFVAITDPGSQLETRALDSGFRAVFHGIPDVGGRFSALSAFGLVPAALAGMDVRELQSRAGAVARSCVEREATRNPGIVLGVTIGVAAREGRDKLTIIASPPIAALGAWLEQLVAESTGKNGRAVIPVDGERPSAPEGYGDDRLFVYLRLERESDPTQDAAVAALEAAGQPVVRLALRDRHDLASQFFLWEVATAAAGAVLGVNPFDQPDVESAKKEARRLMEEVERRGSLPDESPLSPGPDLDGALGDLLGGVKRGDYFAILAWLETDGTAAALDRIRRLVHEANGVATTVGFGPRYLHSTGQAHKGGPDSGVFLLLTGDASVELPVPGRPYGFGVVAAAQSRGDLEVLRQRGRRVLRVHLGRDHAAGLAAVETAVRAGLRDGRGP
jgi:glucose-6-phosphate isomerase